jgi:PadR family transcriptional regulator AphA
MEYSSSSHSFPVEYAALGFLSEAPMHGYELRERLEEGLGALWRIASSQLYSVLHRIEERGWVDPAREEDKTRPARTVYSITEEGRRAFGVWVATPVEHLRDMRVEFLAKVYFARRRSREAVRELIAAQIGVLERLEGGLSRRDSVESDDAGFGGMIVSFRQGRVRSMVDWLQEERDSLIGTEGGE